MRDDHCNICKRVYSIREILPWSDGKLHVPACELPDLLELCHAHREEVIKLIKIRRQIKL